MNRKSKGFLAKISRVSSAKKVGKSRKKKN